MQVKKLALFLIISPVVITLHSGFLETTSGLNQKGNKAFGEKHYDTALDSYRKAQIKNPENPTVRYNVGTTLYQMDQFQEAETQLAQALANAKSKELKALAYYNHGNTQYRLGQFDKAIESYKKALDLNPNDKDAKYNLEVLQKKKSMFDIKQNQRDQNRKDQPPPPSQQDKQQQQQQSSGKDKQDQQSQNQQGQEQNKGDREDQEQQQEQPSQGQQGEEDEEKQNQDQDKQEQDQSQKQDQKEQQKPESEQGQEAQASQQEGEGQENEQPSEPQEQQAGQEQKQGQGEGQEQKPGQETQGEQPRPLLQGQMSKESAGRILDALKASEQELQSLRRPRQQAEHEPLKDW